MPPIGPYDNFQSCLNDQMKRKKRTLKQASRICGFIKKKTEGSQTLSDKQLPSNSQKSQNSG